MPFHDLFLYPTPPSPMNLQLPCLSLSQICDFWFYVVMIWLSQGLLCGHRIGTIHGRLIGVNGGHTREGKRSLFLSLTLPIGSSAAVRGGGPLTPPAFLCRPSGALCCPALAIAKAVGRSGDGLLQLFPLPLASYTFSGHLLVLAQSKCLGRVSSGGDKVW